MAHKFWTTKILSLNIKSQVLGEEKLCVLTIFNLLVDDN